MTTKVSRQWTSRSRVVFGILVMLIGAACGRGTTPSPLEALLDGSRSGTNLLVVLSDTHRLDHVSGFDGAPEALTPRLRQLVSEGVAFDRVLTPVPISAPAYATFMTGKLPLEHGLLNNEQHLGPGLELLQERLRRTGYRTSAVIGNAYCSSGHGFGRGFDDFWDRTGDRGNHGEVITDEAIRLLEANDGTTPFFLFLAYMDAHTPYITDEIPPSLRLDLNGVHQMDARAENALVEQRYPIALEPGVNRIVLSFLDNGRPAEPFDAPSPLHVRELRLASGRGFDRQDGMEPVAGTGYLRLDHRVELDIDNPTGEAVTDELVFRCYRLYAPDEIPEFYAAGVRSFDRSLGRLLDHLDERGLADRTVVVFVSDHGEMLGEHGAWGHVEHLFQESLRVPLVIRAPGVPGGVTDSTPLGLGDLHDLVLSIATGTEAGRAPVQGLRRHETFVAATYPPEGGEMKTAVVSGCLKAIVHAGGDERAYDLCLDPEETTDLLQTSPPGPEIVDLLDAAREELNRAGSVDTLDLEALSEEEKDRLRALGYLAH